MKTRIVLFTIAALAAVTGCSDAGGDAPSTASATVTSTATVTATVAPELPTADAPAKLGDEVAGNSVVVQLLDFDPDTPVDYEGHKRWASALVKTCATVDAVDGKPLEVSWAAWQVSDEQAGIYNITDVTGGLNYPLPTYPHYGQRLTKGQCVRGWVTFNVAPKAKLNQVIYGNGGAEPIHWSTTR